MGAWSWTRILVVASLWGGAFALIKIALDDLSPGALAFLRTLVAAVALIAVVIALGGAARTALRGARPGPVLLLGLLGTALPYLLIGVGEQQLSSGLAAVLLSPVSLFVAGFAPLADRSEIIDRRQAAGFVLGLAGVALVVGVDAAGTPAEALGALALLGATASYAAGNLVVKRLYAGTPKVAVTLLGTTASAALTLPLALADPPAVMPGTDTVAAVLLLGLGSTALATLLFYGLIAREGAARAGVASYLVPPIGLAFGALLLDERITAGALLGLPPILVGVWLASRSARPVAVSLGGDAGRVGSDA